MQPGDAARNLPRLDAGHCFVYRGDRPEIGFGRIFVSRIDGAHLSTICDRHEVYQRFRVGLDGLDSLVGPANWCGSPHHRK